MSKSRARLAADWFAKLRQNAVTQEVEHVDVMAAETEALEAKADAADAAAAAATSADDVMAKVKTVDGSGSGLDADLLDGNHASAFALASHAHDYVPERSRSDWNDSTVVNDVIGQMAWQNYGNNHTIFDASKSISPSGTSVNNTNSASGWTASHPTLMGWNGSRTYGVRVDRARYADSAGSVSTTAGAVGTYALVGRYSSTAHNVGNTVAGSSLWTWEAYSSSNRSSGHTFSWAGMSHAHGFAGTWRWVSAGNISSTRSRMGLAVRIS